MRATLALAGAVLALGLAACSDRERTVIYKQGQYQGKTDTAPWTNAPYSGDKARWESDLRVRNLRQDEYRVARGER